ncbi:hypothetical protein [Flavobacterium filum]|uniref:hypothetical protein n=1 Tax=Flavobacterium filum TaxID=370974 RepID=UPI0023EFB3BD|nr:hypothetical protein [Flavobacterium filum]
MERLFYTLILFGLLSSCGNNNQSANQETTNSQSDNQKILNETAFVKLDNYEYQDNTNGDFSGGSKDGRTIKIYGSTNFPNGTAIEIQTTGFIVSSKEGGLSDTYQEVKVQDGKFSATLNPWNITDQIEFRIFTNKQSKEVIDIIGKTGEKIKVDASNKDEFPEIVIFQSEDYKVNEDIIANIKGGKQTIYKFQNPSELDKAYEKTLAGFVKSWKEKDWNSMAEYCQTSENKNPSDLETFFDLINVLGFQVTSSKEGSKLPSGNILMEVEFTLDVKSSNAMKGIQKKKLKANVIQEDSKWGVNSTSVTGGLYD